MTKTHACPGCGAQLRQSGDLDIDGQVLPVFQCAACVRYWDFDGDRFPFAATFAVDRAGRLIDPESCEPLDPAAIAPDADAT